MWTNSVILLACLAAASVFSNPIEDSSSIALDTAIARPRSKLLIAVVTSPSHFKAREAIRRTWGADAERHGIPVRFFIGQLGPSVPNRAAIEASLQRESKDVVRSGGFIESYHNLTAKALDIYAYASMNRFDGMMKVDDDSYLRVDRLNVFLSQHSDWSNLYAGMFVEHNGVEKDSHGRWYAYDQYPHDQWPPYANGPGVFAGTRAIRHIATNADWLPKIRVDDAAVGVWVDGLNLNRVWMPTSCFEFYPSREAVWVNPVNAEEMYSIHSDKAIVLSACRTGNTACLCSGSPHFNVQERLECWKRASKASYTDVIPRYLLQVEGAQK